MLRTRPPRSSPERDRARLACIRHAASVDPEPGSNSPPMTLARQDSEESVIPEDRAGGQTNRNPSRHPQCVLMATRCVLACCCCWASRMPPCGLQGLPPGSRTAHPLAPSSAHDVVVAVGRLRPPPPRPLRQLVKVPLPAPKRARRAYSTPDPLSRGRAAVLPALDRPGVILPAPGFRERCW